MNLKLYVRFASSVHSPLCFPVLFWQLSTTQILLHGRIYWEKPCKLLIVGVCFLVHMHHTPSYFSILLIILDMYPPNHLAQSYPFLKLIWRECIKKALLWQRCEAFLLYVGNMYKWFDFISLAVTTWIWGAAFYHLPGNLFAEAQILLLAKNRAWKHQQDWTSFCGAKF